VAPFIDNDARTIHFVTVSESAKIYALKEDHRIALSFAYTGKMVLAAVAGTGTGTGVINRNRALVHKLWGPYCDVFFGSGPDDADVAVIAVKPAQAEYRDHDKGKVLTAVGMPRACFREGGPVLGTNAKLDQD
jgi:general stress protein 26